MSTAQALKFIEDVVSDEAKKKHVILLAQSLDAGNILQYAKGLGYDFDLHQFVIAYKLWYEETHEKTMSQLKPEDVADLATAKGSGGGGLYPGGPYADAPYVEAKTAKVRTTKAGKKLARPY